VTSSNKRDSRASISARNYQQARPDRATFTYREHPR